MWTRESLKIPFLLLALASLRCTREHQVCRALALLRDAYPAYTKGSCSADGSVCAIVMPEIDDVQCGATRVVQIDSSILPQHVCRAPLVHHNKDGWELWLDAWARYSEGQISIGQVMLAEDLRIDLNDQAEMNAFKNKPTISATRVERLYAADLPDCRKKKHTQGSDTGKRQHEAHP